MCNDPEDNIIHNNEDCPNGFYNGDGETYISGLQAITPYPHKAKVTNEILDKLNTDATLFEAAITKQNFGKIALQKFFGSEFQTQYVSRSTLEGKILCHGLYKLMETGRLKMYSFDNQASMVRLSISLTQTVLAPNSGLFVLILDGNKKEKAVLEITTDPYYTYFEFNSLSYAITDKFYHLINQTAEANIFYKNQVFTSDGKFVKLPKLSLDDVVLPTEIRNAVNENVVDFIKCTMDTFEANGLPTKRGLIFAGKAGVGKTFTARVLAATAGVSFIITTSVGRSSDITHTYQLARKIAPTIVLFEDVDIYMMSREDSRLAVLLNELDGIEENKKVITIITTNKPEFLDTAIKGRPGRFDRILTFVPPDQELTSHMLQIFTKDVDTSKVDFNLVSQELASQKYTGAHLHEIVLTACMQIVQKGKKNKKKKILKLCTEDLLMASKKVDPTKSGVMGYSR